jgi:hypothetical protein
MCEEHWAPPYEARNFKNAIMGCCRTGQSSAGKGIHMKAALEQVIELIRAPTTAPPVGCGGAESRD